MFIPFQFPALPAGLSLYPSLSLLYALAGVIHTLAYQSLPASIERPGFRDEIISAAIGYTTNGRRLIR
jgi:hypothetical protein